MIRTDSSRRIVLARIIVTTDSEPSDRASVLLEERVSPADFESTHFAAQLMERVSWAVADSAESAGHNGRNGH